MFISSDFPEYVQAEDVLPEGVRIPITEKHIADGWHDDCRLCPIALAINDGISYEHFTSSEVMLQGVVLCFFRTGYGHEYTLIPITRGVRNWIKSFDGHHDVNSRTMYFDGKSLRFVTRERGE